MRLWRLRVSRAELVLVLVALAVRAAYFAFQTQSIYFNHPVLDSLWIHQWASALAEGAAEPRAAYFRAPLYPYVVAGIYAVVGATPWVVAAVQHLVGALMVGLLYRLGRRLFDETVGIVAGALLCFYWIAIFFEGELLIVTLASALGLAFLLALAAAVDQAPGTRRAVALGVSGLLLGLAAIARPNFLVLAPLAVVWPWLAGVANRRAETLHRGPGAAGHGVVGPGRGRYVRDGLLVGAGLLIPILPVTLRNVIVGDDVVLIAAQGGLNLYVGNGPGADGKTAAAPGAVGPQAREEYQSTFRDNVTLAGRAIAEAELGRVLKESEVSAYWLRRTRDHVAEQPVETLGLIGRKVFYLINGFEISDNRDLSEAASENPVLRAAFVRLTWVLPFFWVGAIGVMRCFSKRHIVVYFVLLYSLSIVLFFVNARFRLPLAPAIFLVAAGGLVSVTRMIRRSRPSSLGAPVVLGVLVVTGLLSNVRAFGIDERRAGPAFQMNRAFLLLERGDCAKALQTYEALVAREPGLVEAAYQLARARQRCGDPEGALDAYRAVSRRWPALPYPYIERARLVAAAGDTAGALNIYAEGVEATSGAAELWFALAGLHIRRGDMPAAAGAYERGLMAEPTRLSAWMNYGYTLVRLGRLDAALEAFNRVLQLGPTPDEATMARRNIDRVNALRQRTGPES